MPPFGGRNFWQNEGDGGLCSATFIVDMALAMLFLIRHCYLKRKLVDFKFFLQSSSY